MAEAVTTKKPARKTSSKASSEGSYAVLMTGGKQYLVKAGDKLKIEKLQGEHKEGDSITFSDVIMTADTSGAVTLGKPFISGVSITAKLVKIARYKTVDVIKYKQKSRYFKKYGHRQPYYEVEIESIG